MWGALLAAEQNPTNANLDYMLTIDGLDVAREPATPSRYGVLWDTVRVSEAGPGATSSCQFTIEDIGNSLSIADGAFIRFHDLARDLPILTGSLERINYRSRESAIGRYIDISFAGQESVLDTVIIPSLTTTGGDAGAWDAVNQYGTTILQVLAGYTGLRTGSAPFGADSLGGLQASTLANPLAGFAHLEPALTVGGGANVVFDGMTVRQAFEAFLAAGQWLATEPIPPYFLTVDPWGGVRFFSIDTTTTNQLPTDYATITINNSSGGALAAESINWERDVSPGQVTSYVFVKGPSGSDWRSQNATVGRREAYATTSIAGPDQISTVANAILGPRATPAGRGQLTLTDFTPVNAHPGSLLVITDSNMPGSWSSKQFLITQIDKSGFKGSGLQDWTISFMDILEKPNAGPANVARTIRTITRGTLT